MTDFFFLIGPVNPGQRHKVYGGFREASALGFSCCKVCPTGRDEGEGKWAQEMLALSGEVGIKGMFAHLLSLHAWEPSEGQKSGGTDRETV